MLRLSVELLHYQGDQALLSGEQVQAALKEDDLWRMAGNIEKLFSYMPYEEVESLKLFQNYLSEYREFIRDSGSNKSKRSQIEYLEKRVRELTIQVFDYQQDKLMHEKIILETQK